MISFWKGFSATSKIWLMVCLLVGLTGEAVGAKHYATVKVVDVEALGAAMSEAVFLPNSSFCTSSACVIYPGEVRQMAAPPMFLLKAIVGGTDHLLLDCSARPSRGGAPKKAAVIDQVKTHNVEWQQFWDSSDCSIEAGDYDAELKGDGVVLLYLSVNGGKPHNAKFRVIGSW